MAPPALNRNHQQNENDLADPEIEFEVACENRAWETVWALEMRDEEARDARIESMRAQISVLESEYDGLNLNQAYAARYPERIAALEDAVEQEEQRHADYCHDLEEEIPDRIQALLANPNQ